MRKRRSAARCERCCVAMPGSLSGRTCNSDEHEKGAAAVSGSDEELFSDAPSGWASGFQIGEVVGGVVIA